MSRPDGTHEPPRVRQPLLPRRLLRRGEIGRALGGLVIWLLVALSLPATYMGWVHIAADVFGPWSDGVLLFEDRMCRALFQGYDGPGQAGPLLACSAAIWMPSSFRSSTWIRRCLRTQAALALAFPLYAVVQALWGAVS